MIKGIVDAWKLCDLSSRLVETNIILFIYTRKNNITFYSKILAAILPTKHCKTYSILLKLQESSVKLTGLIGITVELTVISCILIYRKILAAILQQNPVNLTVTVSNITFYCKISCKISNLTVFSCM